MNCRMDFDMVFGISILDPKEGCFMGYGFCMMANFQDNLFFSNIWCFFEQFFAQNNCK